MTAVGAGRVALRSPSSPTEVQARIWSSQRRHPRAPVANMATRSSIAGALDPARFVAAFAEVVRGSDALRTVVVEDAAGVRLRVLDGPPAETAVIDLDEADVDAWCAARVAAPVDATTCPYDSVLLRHAGDRWTWWLDLHHVITDAVSSVLVLEAVGRAYDGAPVDLGRFRDVVAARRDRRAHPRWQAAAAHWAARAARPTAPPLTPYGPLAAPTPDCDRVPVPELGWETDLGAALAGPHRALTPELGLLGVLVTAAAVLVARTDGRESVTIGVPVHHRSREHQRVVGPLLELFPLDVEVRDDDTWASLSGRVRRGLIELLGRAEPGTSPAPDFAVVVNVLTARGPDIGPFPTRTEWVPSGAADPEHLLRVQVHHFGDGELRIDLDVNHAVTDADGRRRAGRHLARLVTAAVQAPDASIGAVVLPDAAELARIDAVNDRSGATASAGAAPVLPDVAIAASLRAAPDRVAVEEPRRTWRARELDAAADGVARWLAAQGIGRGDRVGIRMPRSGAAIVAIQGVLRSGAAFVPLDPDGPARRHDLVVDDAGCACVLDRLPEPPDTSEPVALPADRSIDDLAYLLYTSGSTGRPKGVPISHRGLAGYLAFAAAAYTDPERPPVVALHSSLVFDLTITSLFLPLLVGGTTVVHPGDPVQALESVAADHRTDLLKLTPSQLEIFLRLVDDVGHLRTVVVGGEAFRRPLALALARRGHPDLQIVNEYGPTEAVVGCMIHRFDAERDLGVDVPIGGSCPDSEVFLLDRVGQPVPLGSWGELHVRRPGMAREYWRLDSDRFAVVPSVGGPPLYRTGDRARIERDGVAVYGGRIDDQVKVGGIRLEPGEVEAALVDHPAVHDAIVRLWTPAVRSAPVTRCRRCGVGTDVPGVAVDHDGICSLCHTFDAVQPQAEAWFRTPTDLAARRDAARARRRGRVDAVHLLSGGKDSTYALYRLVEDGWDVHALTLDNGFISEEAKANIERTVADLGVSHEMATVPAMREIFRDSLERFSNVCNGCYKTIYTLAVARAHELGAPVVVTGLSRGQFFETRLVPHQFEAGRFDPDAIDAAVLDARKAYHRTPDAVSEHLDTSLFDDDAIFDEVEFVDFYRYVDVPLDEIYRFLGDRAPWVRPTDTGRSTNCLVNAAGIHVHRTERGFHNYALPYSWDVRLGHKTRDEALAELDDDLDLADVERMLADIGYETRTSEVLTAWYRSDHELDPAELRRHLRDRVPDHAVPAAFVRVTDLPLAASAKVDVGALPAPTRVHRAGTAHVPPATDLARRLCELWADLLGIERIGVEDDFFELGGTSLAALEMVTRAEHLLGVDLPDTAAFRCRTVAELEALVDARAGIAPFAAARSAAPSTPPSDGVPAVPEPIPPAASLVRSPGQDALLVEVGRDPSSPRYALTRRYEIPGGIDVDRFRAALLAVIAAHEPLHHTVADPRRRLSPAEALEWEVVDAAVDRAALARAQARRPFDPSVPPTVRATVVPGDPATVVLSLHHLWCDAGSLDVLWADLDRAYRGESLAVGTVRYRDHAARRRAEPDDVARWDELLAGIVGPADLGLARPAVAAPDGYLRRELVGTDLGPSPLAALLTALDVVLSELTDDPLVVAVPVTTRDHPDVAGLVGDFLDQVEVVLPGTADRSGAAVEAALARSLRLRHVPHLDVVASRRRAGGPAAVAAVMAVHDVVAAPSLAGATVAVETVHNGAAVADLTFFVIEHPTGVDVAAEWSGERHSAADAAWLLERVATVLGGGPLPPPPADAEGAALDAPVALVLDDVARWASSDRVAVTQGDRRATYPELLAAASRVAGGLRRAGVRDGDLVALVVERGIAQVVAVLGTLLAGAGYVPVDVGHPRSRREAVVAASGAVAVVADRPVAVGDRTVLLVDELSAGPAEDEPGAGPRPASDGPAYVIHTSGSTGRPRGVLVRHGQLAASTAARRQHYGHDPARFLWTSSYGFDSSVAGLWWTLGGGGELIVPDAAAAADPGRLVELIDARAVTHALMVPTLWAAVLEAGAGRLGALEHVVVAGEVCPPELVVRHHEVCPTAVLWNEYGPTETTVWATVHRCEPGESPVPIGRPVPGTVARVAGALGRPRPLGVSGELWLAGPQVTAGYVDDATATERRFVEVDGRRWYRTGDRVRRRPDGVIEFLGRDDHQLNLGGVRLEPGEVEAALLDLPDVRAAVVRAEATAPRDLAAALDALDPGDAAAVLGEVRGTPRPGTALAVAVAERSGAPSILVAHVEVPAPGSFDEAEARRSLARRLPAAAVPRRVVAHSLLPRTVHGKIDRGAIPPAPPRPPAVDGGGPADALTAQVLAVWRDVLGDPGLSVDDDVFDRGADSLHALAAVARLSEALGVGVEVAAVVAARTPRGLAQALSGVAASAVVPLRTGGGGSHPPLYVFAQYGGQGNSMLASCLPLAGRLPFEVDVIGLGRPDHQLLPADEVTIERLADDALGELRALGAPGPLWVFGASLNGLVALEVARRWRADGGDVAYVGLADTYFPGAGEANLRVMMARRYRKYVDRAKAGEWGDMARELDGAARRRLGWVAPEPPSTAGAEPATGVATRPDRGEFERGVRRAARDYVVGDIDLPVVLYKASGTPRSRTVDGWRTAVVGLEVVYVTGSHTGNRSFLRAERVGPLADDLRGRLERSLGRGDVAGGASSAVSPGGR